MCHAHATSAGRGPRDVFFVGRCDRPDPWDVMRLMSRGRRGGFGPGPFGFGPGGPGRGGWARGPRARRGDIRLALLLLLAEEPRSGYALMQTIEERTDGAWRPSPGSVYPALSQLQDEGLVGVEEADGRRTFHLTDAGRADVDSRGDLTPPWEEVTRDLDADAVALMGLMREIGMALWQIGQVGTPEQQEKARRVLTEARKALYAMLADRD